MIHAHVLSYSLHCVFTNEHSVVTESSFLLLEVDCCLDLTDVLILTLLELCWLVALRYVVILLFRQIVVMSCRMCCICSQI